MEEIKGIFKFQIEDEIGILTISNGVQNKINQEEFLDLEYFKTWVSENQLKGIIIQGKGRHFSAGADLELIHNSSQEALFRILQRGKEILNYIENLPIVTVAAISGVCFGGGLEIALSCQHRIATEGVVLGFPEAVHGIMPGMGGTLRLPRLVGTNKAIEIILSGNTIDAAQAKEIGLIDKIVPNKQHLKYAKAYINMLCDNRSIEQVKSIITSIKTNTINDMDYTMESKLFLKLVNKIN